MLSPTIQTYIEDTIKLFDAIPEERKLVLLDISRYISSKLKANQKAELVYICTHNSRRSHFGQIWAKVAASHYGLENVFTYSGGTEATAFNPNAIKAIKKIGFEVVSDNQSVNPHYKLLFDDEKPEIECFSKVYDDDFNPKNGFCAIMTCSEAESNCPLVLGAEKRVSTTYEDPKAFDNTPKQEQMYDERCRQIATETLYALSMVKR
ncbi:MAG: protein-tyrosine-phosphatase [Cytophagales bacterium]